MAIELKPLDGGQGHVKAGLLGFPGSGKTYTASLLACAVRERFGLTAPIAMFDTEAGAAWVNPIVQYFTGSGLLCVRSRALCDLLDVARQCAAGAASALVVDSITHPWEETCAAYLSEVNAKRAERNMRPRTRLEFQDWATIKGHGSPWHQWLDVFLNSPLHIALCGRAGFDWDFQESEGDDGSIKKELVKTGVKMRVESQFGFEPALIVEMRRDTQYSVETGHDEEIVHKAIVHKDRADMLTGAIGVFRSFKTADGKTDWAANYEAVKAFFMPHIEKLTPGSVNAVDTALKTSHGVDTSGDSQYRREKRERTIALEEIVGVMASLFPGRSAADNKGKADLQQEIFGTRAWSKIETLPLAELHAGLAKMKEKNGA